MAKYWPVSKTDAVGTIDIFKQSVIERSVLRRQKPGTVFRQK